MSNLWVVAAHKNPLGYEDHDRHPMHPMFEAAGIKHAPCGSSYCYDMDRDHSDVFDRASTRANDRDGERPPVERIDLSKPLYGYEDNCYLGTLGKYTAHPEARRGLPFVFRYNDKHYILDGHHGLSGALLRGDSHADVHMIDLDKD